MGNILISLFFKTKPLHVECFTKSHNISELYPIKRAFHYVPDWWKRLDKSHYQTHSITGKPYEFPTMKTCGGFVELYKNGLILPLWTDIDFFVNKENFSYHSPNHEFSIKTHNSVEHGNNFSDYHHAKILSPWLLRETTGVGFLWVPCTWSHLTAAPKVNVLPAAIDYKHQYTTHVNCFIDRTDGQFRLEAGMPLVQIVPMSDRPVKLSTHILDEVEWVKLASRMHFHKFTGGFLHGKKRIAMGNKNADI